MAQVAYEIVPAGWTVQSQRDALLRVLEQVWGPYIWRGSSSSKPQAYAEFSDFGGAKIAIDFNASSVSNSLLVASKVEPGTITTYKNFVRRTLSINTSQSSSPLTIMAFGSSETKHAVLSAGSTTTRNGVSLLQNVPAFWGSASRVLMHGTSNDAMIAGQNPWGTYDPETGSATVSGETLAFIRNSDLPSLKNTLVGDKAQITRFHVVSGRQAIVGFLPDEWVFVGAPNADAPNFQSVVDELGNRYVVTISGLTNGLHQAIKIDNAYNLTPPDLQGYLYDLDKTDPGDTPGGGETVYLVAPHPSQLQVSGQIYPMPGSLPVPFPDPDEPTP